MTAIQTFLAELEGQGVLSSGESWAELDTEAQEKWMRSQGIETADMTAQEIKEYQTGSWVFVRVAAASWTPWRLPALRGQPVRRDRHGKNH